MPYIRYVCLTKKAVLAVIPIDAYNLTSIGLIASIVLRVLYITILKGNSIT